MNAAPQSIELDDGVRRHPLAANDFITHYSPRVQTLYDVFWETVREHPLRPFLGTRGPSGDYAFETYAEVAERVRRVASGLAALLSDKSQPEDEKPKMVGLFSKNRPEWIVAEQACFARNLVTVPLYDTLEKEAVEYVCRQTNMQVAFCSADKVAVLDGLVGTLLVFPGTESKAKHSKALSMLELEQLATHDIPHTPPCPSDWFTVCYTSGATGVPKGAQLPHSALLANIAAVLACCGRNPLHPLPSGHSNYFVDIGPDELHLSYLPLAHIFERLIVHLLVALGASIGFYRGDVQNLLDDVAALKPTGFLCVPRVCSRIYGRVMAAVAAASWLKQLLFRWAYSSKLHGLRTRNVYEHWLWDWLVFRPIRARLGGRCDKILSGSAPLSPAILEFMRIVFCCPVYEGYGQTETCAGSVASVHGDWATTGHVGAPLPCCEVKLIDIPEMDYYADGGRSATGGHEGGEICIRGPSCFTGYYQDPQRTSETIDVDGWVHTGDVGRWDAEGRLFIIDRKKNIFKLAQGEYIAPERVENVLLKSTLISQVFIHGDSLRTHTVAIVVPELETCRRIEDVESKIALELGSFGKTGSGELSSLELPKAVYLELAPFSIENGLLTATMKVRRHEVLQRYEAVLQGLYEAVEKSADPRSFIVRCSRE